jgi:hypothetical protein
MKPEFNMEDFPVLKGKADENDTYKPDFVPLTATGLNLETELLEQYNRARRVLHDAEYDSDVPLSQKAAALNSATTIIGALIKSQAELYSLERVKKIENALITTLKKYPELQESFMQEYTTNLGSSDDT